MGTYRNALIPVLDLLFPNRCVFCGELLSGGVCVCEGCLNALGVIGNSTCRRCGAPANRSVLWCMQCSDLEFRFNRNVSLGIFDDRLRSLVHLFKFEGRWSLYKPLARLLVDHRARFIARYELLVPVPLSPGRFAERGFNQSALLCRAVGTMTGIPSLMHALERRGHGPPQSSVGSVQQRIRNMTDSFTVRYRFLPRIRGKRVLLVDDVLTTGATASAAAEGLQDAGAKTVDVLTVARALKDSGALYHLKNRPIMK
jgi:ComF family protein